MEFRDQFTESANSTTASRFPHIGRGAVADFGSSQRSAIPGGRGSCRAVRFRIAVARQQPRPHVYPHLFRTRLVITRLVITQPSIVNSVPGLPATREATRDQIVVKPWHHQREAEGRRVMALSSLVVSKSGLHRRRVGRGPNRNW